MKKRFLVLLLIGTLIILGWTVIEYLLQSIIQYQYQQVAKYPVTVYSWDTTIMNQLRTDLSAYDFIAKVEYRTSEQSADELIKKYGLENSDNILQNEALPQLLHIYLKGNAKARANKLILKQKLDSLPQKDRILVEYQNDIWNTTFKRADQWNQIRWIITGFIGLTVFLVFLFKRLHYEHYLIRFKHLTAPAELEVVKSHESYWLNTVLLSFIPVLLGYVLYEIGYTSDWLIYKMEWYFFLLQLGVTLLAAVVAYPFVLHYQHEVSIPQTEK